jgi:hypothetical protein
MDRQREWWVGNTGGAAGRRFPRGKEGSNRNHACAGGEGKKPAGRATARAHMGAVTRDFVAHGAATHRRRRVAGGWRARPFPRPCAHADAACPDRGDRRLLFHRPRPRTAARVHPRRRRRPAEPSVSPAPCLRPGSGHGAGRGCGSCESVVSQQSRRGYGMDGT